MDELLTKQVPQSLEAEQSVLGSMLIDERCVPDVIGLLLPDDFYLQQNRDIYETIYTMFNFSQHIDPVTVLDKMKERGVYDEAHSYDYIAQLLQITPTAANVKQYCAIVRDKALLRNLGTAAGEISGLVQEGVGTAQEILEASEKKIYALRKENSGDSLQHIGKVLLNVYDRLEELAESGSDIAGLSTGLHDLDRKINGLNKSDLLLIAARPGMGKTSLALNVALNVAKSTDKTVAFFSLEMSREQLATRLLSNESFVDNQKLTTGKLDEEDWGKLSLASSALSQTDIRVDDNPAITVAEMNAKCRRLDNLGLVVIDYLQLMTAAAPGKSGENRVTVVSEISRALKIMAKELNVPVICLSQLSRANESRTDKRPMLSDLRESGAIEQDADSVMFIYRDDYYNENSEEKNIAECIVAKNRHGETGTVKLQWLPQFTTFSNLEWKHEGCGAALVPGKCAACTGPNRILCRIGRGGFRRNAAYPVFAAGSTRRDGVRRALQPPAARRGIRPGRSLCPEALRRLGRAAGRRLWRRCRPRKGNRRIFGRGRAEFALRFFRLPWSGRRHRAHRRRQFGDDAAEFPARHGPDRTRRHPAEAGLPRPAHPLLHAAGGSGLSGRAPPPARGRLHKCCG